MFTELINKANAEIERVKQYLKEHDDALFTGHNLKLYDVVSYLWHDFEKDFPLLSDAKQGDALFQWYCNETYLNFCESVKEQCDDDYNKLAHYVGRTSTFYLNDFTQYGDGDNATTYLFSDFYDGYLYGSIDIDENEKLYISEYAENNDTITSDLNDTINKFYNYVVERCAPFIKCYEILKAYKENQVSDFKYFCECYETNLQEQRDAEIAKEKADNETIRAIIEKYAIPENDVITIKNTIYAL